MLKLSAPCVARDPAVPMQPLFGPALCAVSSGAEPVLWLPAGGGGGATSAVGESRALLDVWGSESPTPVGDVFEGVFGPSRGDGSVVVKPDVQLMDFGRGVEFGVLRSAIEWAQRTVRVYGREHPQPRLTRWYGPCEYVYSGLCWEAKPMPSLVEGLRARVEALTGERFNSVLCNLYRDGSDTVGWHADDEPIFGGDPIVASLSFGAERTFRMRPKAGGPSVGFELFDGSLLVMGRGVQPAWEHTLPRTKRAIGERINLTFRLALV